MNLPTSKEKKRAIRLYIIITNTVTVETYSNCIDKNESVLFALKSHMLVFIITTGWTL